MAFPGQTLPPTAFGPEHSMAAAATLPPGTLPPGAFASSQMLPPMNAANTMPPGSFAPGQTMAYDPFSTQSLGPQGVTPQAGFDPYYGPGSPEAPEKRRTAEEQRRKDEAERAKLLSLTPEAMKLRAKVRGASNDDLQKLEKKSDSKHASTEFLMKMKGRGHRYGPDGMPEDESMALQEFLDKDEKYAKYGGIGNMIDQVPEGELGEWQGVDFPDMLLPWFIFALVLLPVALNKQVDRLLAICFAIFVSRKFIVFSKGTPWRILSCFAFVSTIMAFFAGSYICAKYVDYYTMYDKLPKFDNVYPNESPDAFRDAGLLSFNYDTVIDSTKALGYRMGELYCVAPIITNTIDVSATEVSPYGWWAVGTDCCSDRGSFSCGMSLNASVHSGIAVLKESPAYSQNYLRAVRMASIIYNIPVSQDPIFVSWTTDSKKEIGQMWTTAVRWCQLAIILFLAFPMLLSLTQLVLNKDLLTVPKETEKEWEWHKREAAQMKFGFDMRMLRRSAPLELKRDLVEDRCYWSGEILHDYVFNLANSNLFIGPVACHPGHPFTKAERTLLLMLIILVLIFLSATLRVSIGPTSLSYWKPFLILFLTAVPIEIIRSHKKNTLVAEYDATVNGTNIQADLAKKRITFLIIFTVSFVLLTILALVSLKVLGSHSGDVGSEIYTSLAWIPESFICSLILQAIGPVFGGPEDCEELKDQWYFGFFGRWDLERPSYLKSSQLFLWRYQTRMSQLKKEGMLV